MNGLLRKIIFNHVCILQATPLESPCNLQGGDPFRQPDGPAAAGPFGKTFQMQTTSLE